MSRIYCSFHNCKHQHQDYYSEYFIYVKNSDVEKHKKHISDVFVPHKGMIEFHLIRYNITDHETDESCIRFINKLDFERLSELRRNEYTKIHFCRFHAPIESSCVENEAKTKKDVFEDANSLENFNQYIHEAVNIWNTRNQNLLKEISATEDTKEKVRISRELKNLDLKALCFPGDIDFTQHGDIRTEPYSRMIDLSKCRFEANAIFSEVCFDKLVCDDTYFRGRADFRGCHFRLGPSFKDCIFYESAILRGKYSGNTAHFDRSIFKKVAEFMWTKFGNQVCFEDSIFEGRAEFTQATFEGTAIFKSTHFLNTSYFSGVEFKEYVFFENSEFRSWATFRNSNFAQGANYDACSFETVDFLNAAFDGQLVFENSVFENDAFFHYADDRGVWGKKNGNPGTSFRYLSFENAIFLGRANFTNRSFLYVATFKNTIFHKAPEFFNSVLHQGTNFSGAQFLDIKSGWAERSYRTLKVAAKDLNSKREEDLFFSLEQKSLLYQYVYKNLINRLISLRRIAANPFDSESNSIDISHENRNRSPRYSSSVPSWIDLFLSLLYQIVSNYGRSIERNLAWIIALILICAVCYFYWFQVGSSFDESIIFSLKQIFRPFFIYSEKPALGLGVTLFATLQTIVHLVLVTMLVFAVRRRLSIK